MPVGVGEGNKQAADVSMPLSQQKVALRLQLSGVFSTLTFSLIQVSVSAALEILPSPFFRSKPVEEEKVVRG
jgi:hypothetical protein